jgi:hypothetical protein
MGDSEVEFVKNTGGHLILAWNLKIQEMVGMNNGS